MKTNKKKLLIVDDSEIDREILKNILCDYFDLMEASHGYNALQLIQSENTHIDAMLLDLQMPILGGFAVMERMEEEGIDNIPVFLITSEATRTNIHKASKHKFVMDFIKKPYEKDVILDRLGNMLNVTLDEQYAAEANGTENSNNDSYVDQSDLPEDSTIEGFEETVNFISRLETVFSGFLVNNNLSDKRYVRVSDIMRILVTEYAKSNKKLGLSKEHVEIISEAAYFYNIGLMLIPVDIIKKQNRNEKEEDIYKSHAMAGEAIIKLNSSPGCRYFVRRCCDMCMYHNNFFNKGLLKKETDIFPQLLAIAIEFDEMILERPDISAYQFNYIWEKLDIKYDKAVSRVKEIFMNCTNSIIDYYRKGSK